MLWHEWERVMLLKQTPATPTETRLDASFRMALRWASAPRTRTALVERRCEMLRITIVAAALAVTGLTACGGGGADTPRNEPVAAPTPAPPQRSPEELAAIAAVDSLLNSPMTHLTTASATLDWTIYFAPNSRCGIGGTQQITLDGTPWNGQKNFSPGKHALTARFEGCTFAGPFDDIVLNGSVEMVYEASESRNVSAVLTTKAFSWLAEGVVIDGPASYSIESEQGARRYRNDLRAGGNLINPANMNRIDFISGQYTSAFTDAGPSSNSMEYVSVVLDYNAIRYVLDGRIDWSYDDPRTMHPRLTTCKGEVRITDGNGGLVARRYCSQDGPYNYEILKPVLSFW